MGEEENTAEEETQRSIIMPAFQHSSAVMATPHNQFNSNNNKSLHVFRRSRRRQKMQQQRQQVKQEVMMKEESGGCAVDEKRGGEEEEEEEEDEREEVERKIHALQRIVPGGESFGVDKLFDETAGYIVALQYQVKALRALAGFFEKLDKENTKLGG